VDIGEIIRLKNAGLFVPFALLMADGREFHASHPDFMARSPLGRSVTVYHTAGVHYPDVRLIAEPRHHKSSPQTES
jgi:hypothetical protein